MPRYTPKIQYGSRGIVQIKANSSRLRQDRDIARFMREMEVVNADMIRKLKEETDARGNMQFHH